ncbi:hypothetical protein [uncultured Flavobacterium sp.]|uniref:hypothetical protein n=1 Tax=uncultured Flavobacterium sp. TaxID=165435 RepID=UPI00292EDE41|nr:hypothetical protein [uncultured Flavobacterium sp.]
MESQKNRVENEINLWLFREEKVKNLFKRSPIIERSCAKEKLKFYKMLLFKYKKTKILDEIMALQFVKNESKSLVHKIYPNKFERLLYEVYNAIIIERINKREYLKEHENNKKTLEYQLKSIGFHDSYNKVLEFMKQEQSQFSVPVSYYISEKEKIEHSLYFLKDPEGGYQFDGFRSILENYSTPYVRSTHYFKYEKSESFNIEQVYNLLAGRAVFGNGSWRQFNLNDQDLYDNYRVKEFPEAYGYNVEKILSVLPLKTSDQLEFSSLVASLKDGGRKEAILLKDGAEQNIFIEANPQYKSLNIYNESLKKISLSDVLDNKKNEVVKLQEKKVEEQFVKISRGQGKGKSI